MLRRKKKKNLRKRARSQSSNSVATKLKDYSEAADVLEEYEMKHDSILTMWSELKERMIDAEKSVAIAALEESSMKEAGKKVLLTAHGYRVVHSLQNRRTVDALALIRDHPKARGWENLFAVNMKQFDAAVAGKMIDSEGVGDLVTMKSIEKVQVEPETK